MSIVEASYCECVGHALQERQRELSLQWLERLVALLPVDANAVFTSNELLDHIPRLIEEIGKYVAAPEVADIAANTVVTEHARELGQLRHRQQASVHHVLREYDLLAEVLERCLDECISAAPTPPAAHQCLEASRRVGRAVRVLMQTTVATFISEYTDTITAQADRIEQFNRAVSHELRNVLGTTMFSAALLTNGSVSDATNHDRILATFRRNTERALQILRTLEKLPRSGILAADTPNEQIVDLAELAGEVFRQLHDMSEARDVTLRAGDDLPRLYVDTGRLELVLVNLVANAVKYSDARKAERFVEITATSNDHTHEIRVRDNGIGVPVEAIDRIFQRFQRAHQDLDSTLGVDGTGLGLAIVDECVKSLGAEIRVESEEGVGTLFVLSLPKRLPALTVAAESELSRPATPPPDRP
jgi:signal transduction histidine kinase